MRFFKYFLLLFLAVWFSSCKVFRSNLMLKTPKDYTYDKIADSLSKQDYKIEANDIVFRVTGLFIKNNTYYIKVKIQNYSNINYDIDFNKFYIQDEKTLKQTTSQEYEIVPIFKSEKNKETILANSAIENVFAFDKFTLSQNKVLKIMLNEKGGGRHLGIVLDGGVVGGVRVLR